MSSLKCVSFVFVNSFVLSPISAPCPPFFGQCSRFFYNLLTWPPFVLFVVASSHSVRPPTGCQVCSSWSLLSFQFFLARKGTLDFRPPPFSTVTFSLVSLGASWLKSVVSSRALLFSCQFAAFFLCVRRHLGFFFLPLLGELAFFFAQSRSFCSVRS